MNYQIEKKDRNYQGEHYVDLVLTFENGKKWVLVPLVPTDNKKSKSYFYALLTDTATK